METLENKLIENQWVRQAQLESARQEAAKTNKPIWAALVKLGYLSLDDLCVFFAQESGIPYAKISNYKINPEVLRLLDEDFCRQNVLIPLFKIKDTVYLACGNPFDTELVTTLHRILSYTVEFLLAVPASILKALDAFYGPEEKTFALEKLIVQNEPLKGLAFWRESERLPLTIPISLRLEDSTVALANSTPLDGYTRDISRNGTAIGLEVFIFLPKGVNISLEFKPDKNLAGAGQIIKVMGEIAYCRMEKDQHYFLGVRFTEITDEARNQLFALVNPK